MSLLEFTNITPTELSSNGVVALADRPNISSTYGTGGLSPTQLKLWFDKLATLLSARINTVQTALKTSGASYIAVSGLGETITSIADLADSFIDGSFADILLAYHSAADEGDTDNLVTLQTIINTKAEVIAEIAEDLAEYIALIDSNVGAAEIGIADAYNGASKKLSDLVGDIANGVLATKLTFDAYGFATADKATATSTNLKAFVDKVADALQGDISSGVLERIVAIENNIGTTALGTTATTITGAIAEHESDIGGIKTDIGTTDISGIAATVKAAVASLNSDIDSLQQGIVHREIRTLLTSTTAGTLTTELAAAMTDYIVTNLGRQPNLTDAIAVRDTQDVDLSLVYTYYYWTATAADDTEGWYLAAHYKTPAFTETPAYTYSFTAEDWSDTADARGLYTYAIPHTTHGMGETSSLTVRMLKLSGTDYVQINQFEIATDGTVTLFTDDTTLVGIIVIATGTSYYIPALSIYDSVSVDNVIGLGALGTKDTVDEDDITAESDLAAAVTNSHTHTNKAALDAYTADSIPPYDKIIKTQAEFDALIASPTWLGAVSVAFVGQFTYSEANNSGIKVPDTVKQIHGFNGAKITVTNFAYDSSTAKGGLWYDTRPTTNDYSIRDLEVNCKSAGAGAEAYGFMECTNLMNCTGTADGLGGCGFRECTNLTNCTGTTEIALNSYGFMECTNLMNCTGTGTGAETSGYGYGFRECTNLTNCTGTGTGNVGFGFYNITTASNCKDGGSSTKMWGGTNTNIDLDTCCMTPVEAENTTLNT